MKARVKKVWSWIWGVITTFNDSRCSMHAAGLTYYVLLAIVPVLCVLLTGAKALGADRIARDKIHAMFEKQISRFEVDAGLLAAPAASKNGADGEGEDGAPAAQGEKAADGEAAAQNDATAENAQAETDNAADGERPASVTETLPADEEKAAEEAAAAEKAAEEAAEREEAARKVAATQDFIKQWREIEKGLLDKVEQFNVATLGWIGFAMLVWTVISSIGMIELSFNEIWGVPGQRPFFRRAMLDFFVALVMPVLASLALSVPLLKFAKDIIISTAGALWLTKWVSDGAIWLLDSWLFRTSVTLFFSTFVFAFLFKIMPNRPVKWKPAMWSGLFTAILFGGWLKLCAVAQIGIAKSSAIYGSFAFLPIVLAWNYVSWQIVLLGCCIVRKSSQSSDN
ncbi:MAG: YihY/virulence factor BrkB family protein [Kiritimatiellae bacterium]|nr:YihY/virulence factor BrkB family protein [Kiritimatiellia bacterium]